MTVNVEPFSVGADYAHGQLGRLQPLDAGAAAIDALRERLGLDGSLDDQSIWVSLREVGRFADPATRLQAAFDSTLGHWLALRTSDLAAALALVIAVAPSRSA
jgi:hypothetical protein